jgi:hypothetical protein
VPRGSETGRSEVGVRETSAIAILIETTREVLFEANAEAIRADRTLKELEASSIERSEILTETLHKIGMRVPLVKLQEVAGMRLTEIAETFERWMSHGVNK